NRFGQPLLRMTFDFKENDQRLNQHAADMCGRIGKAMNPSHSDPPGFRKSWSVAPYQTTHNTGGAIMGTKPRESAVNTWLQSWNASNVFVVGASAFPHNSAYNPTGPVAALAYRTAEAIRERYLKKPGFLS